MFSANGDSESSYTGLNTAIVSAGGTALQEPAYYWSSSEGNQDFLACGVYLVNGNAGWHSGNKGSAYRVRACLAF